MLKLWPQFFWISIPLYFLASLLEIISRVKPHSFWKRSGLVVGWLAFTAHTAFLVLRGVVTRQAPLAGLFSTLNFFIWCLGLFYFVYALRWRLRQVGIMILPFISVLLFMVSKSPMVSRPLPPVLKTIWFEIHVSSAFISYALFGLGAGAALFSLLRKKNGQEDEIDCRQTANLPKNLKNRDNLLIKRGCDQREQRGNPPELYWATRPEIETELLEDFTYRSLSWGFIIFSASMVSGGIWAYLAWNDYWVWTPKELWSSIIWVYYSTYLHARLTRGWAGKPAQILAVIGFIIVLFTYLGVGLLMKSSHPL